MPYHILKTTCKLFKLFIIYFSELTYREDVVDELKVAEEPKMILVTYYNATISMRFWKKAKVYAVRICEEAG